MPTLRLTPARGTRTALLLYLCALSTLGFTAPQARAASDAPVTDQLPRVVPRSTAPDFARLAVAALAAAVRARR
ncbi:hypothetical protein ABZ465_18075 [Streptomyces griseoincarnatus]